MSHMNKCVAEALEKRMLLHGADGLEPMSTWRVNAGGPALIATDGRPWLADVGFMSGTASSTPTDVANTTRDKVYYATRSGTEFHYHLPVPNGDYRLTILMTDLQSTAAGERVMDVELEGKIVLNDFDIVKQVGPKAAVTKSFSFTVIDGIADVKFYGVTGEAVVSGLELLATKLAPTPTPTPSSKITWGYRSSMPVRLAELATVVVDGKMLVFGGYSTTTPNWQATDAIYRYDPAADKWARIGTMPARMNHMAHDTDGRYVYLAGAYTTAADGSQTFATQRVYRYDTRTSTFDDMPELPEARGAGAMVLLGRRLHFMGGVDGNQSDHRDHWTLDLDDTAAGWQSAGQIPDAKNHGAAIVHDGSIYLLGGQIGETHTSIVNQASVFRYNPAGGGVWTRLADMPTAKSHIGSNTLIANGRMYVMGGISNAYGVIAETAVYDFAADRWTTDTSLRSRRHSGASAFIGGKIYYAGGYYNGLQMQTFVGTFS